MKSILNRAVEVLQSNPDVGFTSTELAAEILKDPQFAVMYELKLSKRDYINKRATKKNRALLQLTETITTLAPRISCVFGMSVSKLNGRLVYKHYSEYTYTPKPLCINPQPTAPIIAVGPVQQAKPSVISRVLRFFKRG